MQLGSKTVYPELERRKKNKTRQHYSSFHKKGDIEIKKGDYIANAIAHTVCRNTAATSCGQLDQTFSSHQVLLSSVLSFSLFQLYIKLAEKRGQRGSSVSQHLNALVSILVDK